MWKSRLSRLIPKAILFCSGALTCIICLHFLSAFENQDVVLSEAFVLENNNGSPKGHSRGLKSTKSTPCDPLNVKYPDSANGIVWSHAGNQNFDNLDASSTHGSSNTVWVVTPTYYRPEQKPELTRLAQTLLLVRSFVHWLVVDDIGQGTDASFRDLKLFLAPYTPALNITFLRSIAPEPKKDKIVGKPRGVGGRRAALQWLRDNKARGVLYFADDDNTYNYDIFRQMRNTEICTMWPVGLVTDLGVSSPIVKNGKIVGFYDGWNGLRTFPVDMAGFAVNLKLVLSNPKANMPWIAGYEEDELLKTLGIKMDDIKPLANNCTEILVWHTKGFKNPWPKKAKKLGTKTQTETNLWKLLQKLPQRAYAGPVSSVSLMKKSPNSVGLSIFQFLFGGHEQNKPAGL